MENIGTPNELNIFMQENIRYGYLGKNNKIHSFDEPDFNEKWLEFI